MRRRKSRLETSLSILTGARYRLPAPFESGDLRGAIQPLDRISLDRSPDVSALSARRIAGVRDGEKRNAGRRQIETSRRDRLTVQRGQRIVSAKPEFAAIHEKAGVGQMVSRETIVAGRHGNAQAFRSLPEPFSRSPLFERSFFEGWI